MLLNNEISTFLQNEYVDYIGFADLANYQDELVEFGGEIVRGYKVGISIGIALPNSIVDHLPNRFDDNVACQYRTHCYDVINIRLHIIASKLASFLHQQNYQTLPIAAAETTDFQLITPTVSHKMIAHIAGLGWIGKNCLLITPQHGPRVRFISLLTTAPLAAKDEPMLQKCNACMECMKICPTQAIKGVNYQSGEEREVRLDAWACKNYFTALQEQMHWQVCGMCLYVCPYGRKNKNVGDGKA